MSRSSIEESLSSHATVTSQCEATSRSDQNQYEGRRNVSNKQNKQGVRPKSPNRKTVQYMTQPPQVHRPIPRKDPSQMAENAGFPLEESFQERRPAEQRSNRSANLTASNESLNDIANRALAQSLHNTSTGVPNGLFLK